MTDAVTPPSFEDLVSKNASRVAELENLEHLRGLEPNELAIRSAINRFAHGATSTDGSWTVVNLVQEAGLGRATVYRYKRELQEFQDMAVVSPKGGYRDELKRLRAELKAERKAAKEERERHQHAEDIMLERIHALSLLVASALGKNGVPVLFPEFARRKANDEG